MRQAGRERPGQLQIFDVRPVDLIERAEPRARVIFSGHSAIGRHPLDFESEAEAATRPRAMRQRRTSVLPPSVLVRKNPVQSTQLNILVVPWSHS